MKQVLVVGGHCSECGQEHDGMRMLEWGIPWTRYPCAVNAELLRREWPCGACTQRAGGQAAGRVVFALEPIEEDVP